MLCVVSPTCSLRHYCLLRFPGREVEGGGGGGGGPETEG